MGPGSEVGLLQSNEKPVEQPTVMDEAQRALTVSGKALGSSPVPIKPHRRCHQHMLMNGALTSDTRPPQSSSTPATSSFTANEPSGKSSAVRNPWIRRSGDKPKPPTAPATSATAE
ncbi:unnamed protein product [Lota lota]